MSTPEGGAGWGAAGRLQGATADGDLREPALIESPGGALAGNPGWLGWVAGSFGPSGGGCPGSADETADHWRHMSTRGFFVAYLGVMAAAMAMLLLWPASWLVAISAVTATAVAGIFVGVRRHHPRRGRAWLFLAAALVCNAAARVVYVLLPGQIGTLKPWVWMAFALHLIMLAFLIAGFFGLAKSNVHGRVALIDATIIVMGAGLVAGVFIALPYARRPGLTGVEVAVRDGYMLRDIDHAGRPHQLRDGGALDLLHGPARHRRRRAPGLRRDRPARAGSTAHGRPPARPCCCGCCSSWRSEPPRLCHPWRRSTCRSPPTTWRSPPSGSAWSRSPLCFRRPCWSAAHSAFDRGISRFSSRYPPSSSCSCWRAWSSWLCTCAARSVASGCCAMASPTSQHRRTPRR